MLAAHESKSASPFGPRIVRAVSSPSVHPAQSGTRLLTFRKERTLAVGAAVQYGAGGDGKLDVLVSVLESDPKTKIARGRLGRCFDPKHRDALSPKQIERLAASRPEIASALVRLGVGAPQGVAA